MMPEVQQPGKILRVSELRRWTEGLVALHALHLEAGRSHDLEGLLQATIERAVELLQGSGGYLYFCDPNRQELILVAGFNTQENHAAKVLKYGEGPAGAVASTGQALIIDDYGTWPGAATSNGSGEAFRSGIAVPVGWQGKVPAVIQVIHNRDTHFFDQQDLELLELFGRYAAITIENAALVEKAERQAREMQILEATASDISTVLEVPQLLRAILERACMLLGATGGDLCLFNDERGDLEIVTNHNMGANFSGTRIALGQGAAGQVALTHAPLIIEDYQKWEHRIPDYDGGPWHTVMVVPMLVANRLVGVIGVFDDDPNRIFTRSDEKLLTLLAQQSAIAIVNARLYDMEKKRAAELALLFESSTNITKTLDFRAVLNMTAQQLARAANATSAYVLSYDQDKGEAVVLADFYSPEASETEKATPDIGVTYDLKTTPKLFDALRSGQAWLMKMDDLDTDPVSQAELRNYGIKSALALPMMLAGRVHAYAEIWDSRNDRDWSNEEVRLCQTLANQATTTIENARLFDESQQQAVTDPLTGLYNRRGLFQLGERELDRVRRFGHPLTAIMLDIDHFKRINDTYSHAAGDVVLQALAERCRGLIRDTDILGRYGGEEFALLLPETDIPGAQLVAERLRKQASATPVMTSRGPIQMTISLGLTAFSEDIPDLAVLLDHADTAMYAAKQEGRNRVTIG